MFRNSTHDDLSEICKQSALEEAEGPEPVPKERTMTVLKLVEGLGLTVAGISMFGDNDWNKKGTVKTGQGILRMLAYCEEILKEKEMSLSARFRCNVSLKHLQESCVANLYCWMDLQFQRKCFNSKLPLRFAFHI
jgi:hypothetical protein